jgi:DNA polymerase-3 subunit beta
MRAVVERQYLSAALDAAGKYAARGSPIPILTTVLLKASGGGLDVASSDLDRSFQTTVAAEIDAEGGVAVNSAMLADFVNRVGGADVSLTLDGTRLIVRSGSARATLPVMDASDHPADHLPRQPPVASFVLDAGELTEIRNGTAYAVAKDVARYYLGGVCWSVQARRLECCATNGHVLALLDREAPGEIETLAPVIVPDFVLPSFSGPVLVEVGERTIRLSGLAAGLPMAVASKLIDGTFPGYSRIVVPPTATALVPRKPLVVAVARCLPLRATIDLVHDDNTLVLTAKGEDGAEVEDRIDGVTGTAFATSLAGHLLAPTLATFKGASVEIGFTTIGAGVQFADPGSRDHVALVMPIRGGAVPRIGK